MHYLRVDVGISTVADDLKLYKGSINKSFHFASSNLLANQRNPLIHLKRGCECSHRLLTTHFLTIGVSLKLASSIAPLLTKIFKEFLNKSFKKSNSPSSKIIFIYTGCPIFAVSDTNSNTNTYEIIQFVLHF